MRRAATILACLLLAGCGGTGDDGVVDVAIIGEPGALDNSGLRLDLAGQHLRAATAQGLVRLDTSGEVVPAIAERWIVTDDGTSYIFRIREFDLPDGPRLTAQAVRDSLNRTIARLDGTSMGLDFSKLRDIRAMTGRVVEIRLKSPMPGLLQLLAQPEMGLVVGKSAIGPMVASEGKGFVALSAMAPELRGLPIQPGWEDEVRGVRVSAVDARAATQGFADGRYDVVLGGRLVDFPLADAGPLSRGTIRLDSAIGLFGFDIAREQGFLAEPANREALAMALDREALINPFNIAGWVSTARLIPPGLPGEEAGVAPRWEGLSLEERRALASRRIAAWRAANGDLTLSLALPDGPGSDQLFAGLAAQWSQIGVRVTRAGADQRGEGGTGSGADLVLRDRVARYPGGRWFLNQFNCRVTAGICSQDVDFLVDLANGSPDPVESASYIAEAEAALTAFTPFIPIGAPIRWSLIRADVEGFTENPWNLHPLFALSRAPI